VAPALAIPRPVGRGMFITNVWKVDYILDNAASLSKVRIVKLISGGRRVSSTRPRPREHRYEGPYDSYRHSVISLRELRPRRPTTEPVFVATW